MPRAAPRLAAVDAMDAEGGTALTAPQLLSDACNHCVVVVDTPSPCAAIKPASTAQESRDEGGNIQCKAKTNSPRYA